jgi:hypothetical protein
MRARAYAAAQAPLGAPTGTRAAPAPPVRVATPAAASGALEYWRWLKEDILQDMREEKHQIEILVQGGVGIDDALAEIGIPNAKRHLNKN